ncbi:hypothetical protein F8B43_1353 [Methylorubrum populi]|uniref:Uncharacterized protein n=1 Tax=Methylorubrum populi TaxID=223967 RepID=A0A833J974_9HYPH|nr:hypothetical protein F8B43_1353 [Methylorubrum populi]
MPKILPKIAPARHGSPPRAMRPETFFPRRPSARRGDRPSRPIEACQTARDLQLSI